MTLEHEPRIKKKYKDKLNGEFIKYNEHSNICYCPVEIIWDKIHCKL